MRSSTVLAKRQQPIGNHNAVRYGVCGSCPSGCGIKAFFHNRKLVDIFGDEEHPLNKGSLCPKGLALYHVRTHPKRLSLPCVREKLTEAWTEVSWDEALAAFTQRLAALSEEGAIALPSSLHDPLDYAVGAEWCASALPHAYGPASFVPTPLGMGGKLAAMFGIPGAALSMNAQRDWAMSRVILIVGGDMAAESPITFGPLEDARDRGSTLLYLGSHNGMTAARANDAMLVLPGTESAALGALVHILLREEHLDEAFLAEYAAGLDTLRNTVADMTPEQAARLCGIPEEQLERFAEILGHRLPLQVQPVQPLDDNALALCGALVTLRGCIGIPGGGLNLHAVSPFRSDNLFGQSDVRDKRLDMMLARKECRALIGFGNWAAYLPGGEGIRAAVRDCELVVHIGCFDDDTRALSHISLPAAHWSEYASLSDISDTRAIQWREALFQPFGQSRTPLDIWTGVMARLAPSEEPPWQALPHETDQRRMASFVLASHPFTRGITLEALEPAPPNLDGGIQWPCPEASDAVLERSRYIRGTIRGRNILFSGSSEERNGKRFATQGGRIRLDAVSPPLVRVAGDALSLVLAEPVTHAVNEPVALPHEGYPPVFLHPETAMALRVDNDELVRVTSDGASVKAAVRVTGRARKRTAVLEPAFGSALLPVGYAVPTTAVTVEKM